MPRRVPRAVPVAAAAAPQQVQDRVFWPHRRQQVQNLEQNLRQATAPEPDRVIDAEAILVELRPAFERFLQDALEISQTLVVGSWQVSMHLRPRKACLLGLKWIM